MGGVKEMGSPRICNRIESQREKEGEQDAELGGNK